MDVIDSLCADLDRRTDWRLDEVVALIQAHDCRIEQLAQHVPHASSPEGYGRKVLYRSDGLELILTYFPADFATPVHDHGGAAGCCYVVSGRMVNRCYHLPDAKSPPQIVSTEQAQAGEAIYLASDAIHSTYNPGPQALVTLNVYSPPQEHPTIYPTEMI